MSSSGFWILVVLLHKPVDRRIWLHKRIWRYGRHQRCSSTYVDSLLLFRKESSLCNSEMVNHEVDQLECRS